MRTTIELLFDAIEEDSQKLTALCGSDLTQPHKETDLLPIPYAAFLGHWKILSEILGFIYPNNYNYEEDKYKLGDAFITLITVVNNLQDPDVQTCFHQLMDRYAQHNPKVWQRQHTPIWLAVMNNNTAVLEKLMEKDPPYLLESQKRNSPILLAANKGYFHLIPTLVNGREHHPGDYEQYGYTLEKAVAAEELEAITCLLKNGKHIAQKHKDHALFQAVKKGNLNILVELINGGADLKSRQNGQTAIMVLAEMVLAKKAIDAVDNCDFTMMEYLINHLSQTKQNCFDGENDLMGLDYALMAAVHAYRTDMLPHITKLVALGANPTSPDARDDNGHTAYHRILAWLYGKHLASNKLFPILYSSPKLNRMCRNTHNKLPIEVINGKDYTKLVADCMTPRLMLLIMAIFQSRYDNKPNPLGGLPFDVLDFIIRLTIIARPLLATEESPSFIQSAITRRRVSVLKNALHRKNLIKVAPKAMQDLIAKLSQEHSHIGITKRITECMTNIYDKGEHHHPDTSFIKQFLTHHHLTTELQWSHMNVKYHVKVRDQLKDFLSMVSSTPASKKLIHTCPITQRFIEILTGLKTEETIKACVDKFLRNIYSANQFEEKSIIFDQLVNTKLTSEVYLETLKEELKEDIYYKKHTQAFLQDYQKTTMRTEDLTRKLVQELSVAPHASDIKKLVNRFVYTIYSTEKNNHPDNILAITLLKKNKLITEKQLQEVMTLAKPNVTARKQVREFTQNYRKINNLNNFFKQIIMDENTKIMMNFLNELEEMVSARKIHRACVRFIDNNIYQYDTQKNDQPLIAFFMKYGLINQEDIEQLDAKYAGQKFSNEGEEEWTLVTRTR